MGNVAEIGVGAEGHEDESAEDEGDEEAAAQAIEGHGSILTLPSISPMAIWTVVAGRASYSST